LTPELFWKFEDEILFDEEFINEIVDSRNSNGASDQLQNVVKNLTQIGETKIFIGSKETEISEEFSIVSCSISRVEKCLNVNIVDNKKNKNLESNLKKALNFIEENLNNDKKIAIICNTGNNESICVAVAALVSFYDDKSKFHICVKFSKINSKESQFKKSQNNILGVK
jgi:hypothetical protein